MAIMSILGLYDYDPTIMDGLTLPVLPDSASDLYDLAGVEPPNKDVLITELCLQLAELEIIYPDPDVMRKAIAAWSAIRLPVWQRMYNTTLYSYNPIHNKDANIDRQETRTPNLVATSTIISNHTEGSSETGVSAFNASDYQARDKITTSADNTGSSTVASTGTETIRHVDREYGNVGVTATQHLIQMERDISAFDIYQYIIDDFRRRFCLLVY